MKALIILAHPNPRSLNGALFSKTKEALELNPNVDSIESLDLYSAGFDPLLHFDENKRRRDMHKDPELSEYQQQLRESDMWVFIYPIWWGRPPAMLMGYFDRLFASNFAYRDVKGKLFPEGLMKGKEVVCVSTMKGPGGYLQYWLYNAHRNLMKKALFNFVGIVKIKFFELGDMETQSRKQAQALNKIFRYFHGRNLQIVLSA